MEKIFIIDDDPVILKFAEYGLKKGGFDVSTFTNGKVALEQIPVSNPALIITDMLMPEITGLEVVRYIRLTLQIATPVVIISAGGTEESVSLAKQIGVNDFLSKPFGPAELLEKVKKLLQ